MQVGTKISDRYELREILGQGTLGPCYKGFDSVSGKSFVAKTLTEKYRKQKKTVQNFLEHFEKLQKRTHEGFPRILDIGEQDGTPYVIEEYLEGLSLRQLMTARREEETTFSLNEAESICEEAGQLLSWLHHSGIHGSVKPENVFLLPERIKLADDGLMEVLPPETFAAIQIRNPTTAPYCAPELLSDPDSAAREIDVFGLAAIFYELLAGAPPETHSVRLLELRPDLPDGIEKVVAKGLSDDPRQRYPTVNTFLLDLARLSGDKHKIDVLEAVVEEEAAAEAERAMAAIRGEQASQSENELTLEPASTESTETDSEFDESRKTQLGKVETEKIAAEEARSSKDVSHLFVDDSMPDKLPDMGIAGQAPIPADEQTDLLSPTPTISSSGSGKNKSLMVVAIIILVAALGGAGAYFSGALDGYLSIQTDVASPDAPSASDEEKPTKSDARLEAVVKEAIADVEKKRAELLEMDPAVAEEKRYLSVVELMDDAREALGQLDFDTALQLTRIADGEIDVLADKVREAEQAARQAVPPPAKETAPPPRKSTPPPAAPKRVPAPAAAAKSACPDGMVKVPGGSYMAGSPPEDLLRDPTERELEQVQVETFCIDMYEFPNKKGARPKISVTQTQAEQACASEGKRLCLESEWEKVCKGPRNNDYPYGKVWDPNICNTETATGEDRTLAPTGSRNACKSDYGVFDMSGNVLEWTASSFEGGSGLSIAKGGSYMRPDYAARCAYRYTAPSGTKDVEIGFRCCTDW